MDKIESVEEFFHLAQNVESKKISKLYSRLSAELKKRDEIKDYVLKEDGQVFEFFDEDLKKDKEYILSKLSLSELSPYMLGYIDDSLVGDEDLLKAACETSFGFHQVLNDEKWNKDEEWYIKLAGYCYPTIHFMPDYVKNSEEVCKAFLDKDMRSFNVFSDKMKNNRSVQEHALKKDGHVFQIFPESYKCKKEYIREMLSGKSGEGDNRCFMIFHICDDLKNDKELVQLAIKKDHRIFEDWYSKQQRTKELFEHYLKITADVYRYLPKELRENKDIYLAVAQGEDNKHYFRRNLLRNCGFYNDKQFAKTLISLTDYPGSLQYLSPEIQSDPEILNAFKSKFNEPEHLAFIKSDFITKDIADFYIDHNFDAICHINNIEITQDLLAENRKEVKQRVRYSNPDYYHKMTGALKNTSDALEAFLHNPMISNHDLAKIDKSIQVEPHLLAHFEKLTLHLEKPEFKNRFNANNENESANHYKKGIDRKDYVNSLEVSDNEILTLLLSDEYRWVREATASKVLFEDHNILDLLENGTPVIKKENDGWMISFKHDRYVLNGLLKNPKVKTELKDEIRGLLKDENKYRKEFDSYELGYIESIDLVASQAGEIKKEQLVDCIMNQSGNWEDYLLANDLEYDDDFWSINGVQAPATDVKLPDGTFLPLNNLPESPTDEDDKKNLKEYLEKRSVGIAVTTQYSKPEGWGKWRQYKIDLEYEFDPESVIPNYEQGYCIGYKYSSDYESAIFTVNDTYSNTDLDLSSNLFYFKDGNYEVLDLKKVFTRMTWDNMDVSDKDEVINFLNDYLASYFNSYPKILENNGYNFKTFPKNKLPVIPFDTPMKETTWHEGSDRFIEILMDQEIPMNARLEKGIMYFGDHFLINSSFSTPFLLTTQGMATRNPQAHAAHDYIFIPFDNFTKEVGLYQHEVTGRPFIRLVGNNDQISLTSKLTENNKPFVDDDEILFIYNIIRYWIESTESDAHTITFPIDSLLFLKSS